MMGIGDLLDLSLRLVVAVALGAVIGLERQWRLRMAGIRTNALVSVGAALFVIVGSVSLAGGDQASLVAADPTRVAAQVVSGIGFLGAGVILRDGLNIRGLTTAATLWCAAAIGSLAGAGMEVFAVIGSAAILATNTGLRPISRMVNQRFGHHDPGQNDNVDGAENDYMLEVVTSEKSEQRVRALVLQTIGQPGYALRSLDIRASKPSRVKVLAGVTSQTAGDTAGLQAAVQRISLDPKVISSRWWPTETED